jgi:hypothetical protein
MDSSTSKSTLDSQTPIALSDIRTGPAAVCLHDAIAFLLQCPVNKYTKQDISRFLDRNKSAFPCTLIVLAGTETKFEPKAGHKQRGRERGREHHAIRTPERLVEVIKEYLQHHHTKSAKCKANKVSKYDSVKAQSRVLADHLAQHYLPNLWPGYLSLWPVNVREHPHLFAPFFGGESELPGNEDDRQGPSPTPSTPTAGPSPQVNLCVCFKSAMKSV